jgi:hypothetical protein
VSSPANTLTVTGVVSLAVPEKEGVVSFDGDAGGSSATIGAQPGIPTDASGCSQEACAAPVSRSVSAVAGGRAAAGAAAVRAAASATTSGGTAASRQVALHPLALRLLCTAHRSTSHQALRAAARSRLGSRTTAPGRATIVPRATRCDRCKIPFAVDPGTGVVIDVAPVTGVKGQQVKRGGLTGRSMLTAVLALALALPATALASRALGGRTYEGGAPGWGVNREGHRLRTHASGNVVLKVARSGGRVTVRFSSTKPVLYCNTQQPIRVQSGHSAPIKSDGTFKLAVGERFKAGPGPPAIVQVLTGRFTGATVRGTISTHAAECGGSTRFSARAR